MHADRPMQIRDNISARQSETILDGQFEAQQDAMAETAPPTLPGTRNNPIIIIEPVFNITCRDVAVGKGQRTQSHCGNVTYRRLVQLQKVRGVEQFLT